MEFSQIALLIGVAGVFGVLAQYLKQPLLVGYLFAGILLAHFGVVKSGDELISLGQIGTTLLLFLLGLEMNIRDIPFIGKTVFLTGVAQVLTTVIISLSMSTFLGFSFVESLYIAIAISFSSTVIGVKLLSEKKDLGSLYGKLSVGILLIQDIIAIVILMFLSSNEGGFESWSGFFLVIVKGILLFGLVALFSKKIIPTVFERLAASSQELTFIISIAWALCVASFVKGTLGFTLEIGGFLAGISLSNIHEHIQIGVRTRNLRDFFLTLFFILLGTQVIFGGNLATIIPVAFVFSLIVLIIKPLAIMMFLELMGYKRRTAFLSGVTLAQVSEFSLILVSVGLSLGHIGAETGGIVTLVGVITMLFSSYLIAHEDRVFELMRQYIGPFERKINLENATQTKFDLYDHIVLVGCDRTGNQLLRYLKKKDINFVVIDFNPKIFNALIREKIPAIFGDIGDHETMEIAALDKSRLIISTIPNITDNLAILEHIRMRVNKPFTIMVSQRRTEALKLYEKGATYVIVPEVVAGDHIRHILRVYGTRGSRLERVGKNHFNKVIFS